MASVKLTLNRSRVLKNGYYPLVFQLIHQRKKKLIYTSYKLFPEEFDMHNAKVRYLSDDIRSVKEVRRMNRKIQNVYKSLIRYIETLESNRHAYNVADIVFLYHIENESLGLLYYIDKQIIRKHALGRYGIEAALRNTRASVALFTGLRTVYITDVNTGFVRDYVDFLQHRGVSHNTICYYIRNLKSVYYQAVREGYRMTGANPFENVHTSPRKTVKRALDRDMLSDMYRMDFSIHPNLELARDMFFFSFFCRGMPFVDLIFLKKKNINNGMISYNRYKTNQWLQVSLTPQLHSLIQKYDDRSSEYIFPVLKTGTGWDLYRQYRLALERINRNLKFVAQKCGITVPLTTYVARHSWATLAKNSGAPIAVISEGLGHTSEKTTQIYLKDFDQHTVDHVNLQVIEQIAQLRSEKFRSPEYSSHKT